MAPGSLVRSSTAMLFTVGGSACRKCSTENGRIRAHFQHADFLALGREVVHRLLRRLSARAHDDDDVLGVRRALVLEELVLAADDLARTCPSRSARWSGRPGSTDSPSRGPGSKRRDSAPSRAARDDRARARGRDARAPGRRRSWRACRRGSAASILETSCEVRKPSKKCRKGMRDSSVAACAISARSIASCTEFDDSSANPVARTAMASW